MAKYLTSVYVSGWQCSSTASTSNEPGPDVADYPYDTVPNKAWWNVDVRSSWYVPNVAPEGHHRSQLALQTTRWISSSARSSSTTASSTRSAAVCLRRTAPSQLPWTIWCWAALSCGWWASGAWGMAQVWIWINLTGKLWPHSLIVISKMPQVLTILFSRQLHGDIAVVSGAWGTPSLRMLTLDTVASLPPWSAWAADWSIEKPRGGMVEQ